MQAYVLNGFGDGGGIDLVEAPTPTLGPRDVLMRVRAASVNYRDVMIQRGSYPVPASVDTVPLSDGAGEVAAIGPEVTRFVVGDRVAAAYFPKWTAGRLTLPQAMVQPGASRDGMLAEYYAADEAAFVGIPQHLSFEEASTLPCAAVTAWSAVNGHRPIIPGETVLVVGGGSVAGRARHAADSRKRFKSPVPAWLAMHRPQHVANPVVGEGREPASGAAGADEDADRLYEHDIRQPTDNQR